MADVLHKFSTTIVVLSQLLLNINMSIIPKLKKPVEAMTVLEKEKALARLRSKTEELIDEMGQDSDKKALRTVQEYTKEQNKDEELRREIDEEQLKRRSTNKQIYQRYLLVILQRFILEEQIPKKYKLFAESNDTGIIMGILGTDFYTAFKVIGIPKYDINACKISAVRLGNTIAKMEGYVQKSEGGIILPDHLDKKKYGRNN